ncbi:MAG: nucleotidyltransferase [Acidobacteria bacterium]|nr:nucleotidyltransferase [Acidobacteriota bacterium]
MSRRSGTPYEDALRAVLALLDDLPGPGMIIGGLAVIAQGHVRATEDIDVTVSGASVTAGAVIDVAARHGIVSRIDDPVAFAERTQVLLLVHERTGVEVDLSLAWIPFEEEALARQQVVAFGEMTIRVCHPEDLIIYKLVAARPLDLEDARQLTLRHGRALDRERIQRTVAGFDEILEDGRSRLALWLAIERSTMPP